MAWTSPPTYTSGTTLTAAQMNAISANLNETAPAKATAAGTLFVGNGANSIVEHGLQVSRTNTVDTTANTNYVELANQQHLTVTCVAQCAVWLTGRVFVGTAGSIGLISFVGSGASAIAASDQNALMVTSSGINDRVRASAFTLLDSTAGLVAGTTLFKAVSKVSPSGTGTFADREMAILPL